MEIVKAELMPPGDSVQIVVSVTESSADVYEFRVGWDGLPEVRVLERNRRLNSDGNLG